MIGKPWLLRTRLIVAPFFAVLVLLVLLRIPTTANAKDVSCIGVGHIGRSIAKLFLPSGDDAEEASDTETQQLLESIRQIQKIPESGFSQEINGTGAIQVLLVNGVGDEDVLHIFRPEDGKTIEDYDLVPVSTNTDVLPPEDVSITYVADTSTETLVYNVTSTFDFNGWTGVTNYSINAVDRESKATFAQTTPTKLTAVGMTFFFVDSSGNRTLVGGDSNPLQIDYTDLLTDNLFDLSVFIQYADGTDSTTSLNPSFPMTGITQAAANLDGQLIHDNANCSVTGGTYDGSDVKFNESCAIGFSTNQVNGNYVGPHYGFEFERYRNGSFQVNFSWDNFTTGTEFDGEQYGTFIDVAISGAVPVLVWSITPDGPFARPGGDEIEVIISNAASNLQNAQKSKYVLSIEGVGEAKLKPESIKFDDISKNQTLTFVLPEGNGTNLPWNLTVTYASGAVAETLDITNPTYLFDYDDRELRIDSITPTSGNKDGGTQVTISGSFPNFDPTTFAGIYMGGQKIDPERILNYSDTLIVFSTPPREEIGSSSTYVLTVNVGKEVSNGVKFEYEETGFVIDIQGSGGSFNEDTGNYEIGACGETIFSASIPPNALPQVESYQWRLLDPNGVDVLTARPDILSTSETILLPYDVFPSRNVVYVLSVQIVTKYETLEKSYNLIQLDAQRIGVRIYDPRERSVAIPDTPLTIPSDIGIPGCLNTEAIVNSTAITYQWEFRSETYLFSYLNDTAPRDVISPTLLGREINIPQAFLEYGRFPLRLTAFFTERPEVRGSDTSVVIIRPASLIAQINNGESEHFVAASSPFQLTGTKSRDPDVLEEDPNKDLEYIWTCRYGNDTYLKYALPCPEGDQELLPSGTDNGFEISPSAFEKVRESTKVFIQYKLKVSKTSKNATGDDIVRESKNATAILILSELPEVRYETLTGINVTNSQSKRLDLSNVKYFEDVTITPLSSTEETKWKFELLEPVTEARTLLSNSKNLFTAAGFYSEQNEPARDSLGIRGGVLKPSTSYLFSIEFFRPGYEDNAIVLELRTVEEPSVLLSDLPRLIGDTNTTFAASAGTSYSGDFKFYFIMIDAAKTEYCLDGCQGVSSVSFRVGTPGTYSIRCDLYDSLGFQLLANNTFEQQITVSSAFGEDSSLEVFEGGLDTAYKAGDHADFQQLGEDMVKYVLSNGGSNDNEVDSEILKNFTSVLNQVSANAVPNSIQSTNYIRTAAALAQLTPDKNITYDVETLYLLVNITRNSVSRTPDTAALRQIQDLLDFYNEIPALGLALYVEGTTRRRLLQDTQDREIAIRSIWLDVYETMKEQVVVTAQKTTACGALDEYVTGVPKRKRKAFLERQLSTNNDTQVDQTESSQNQTAQNGSNQNETSSEETNLDDIGPVAFGLGHICNPEQGLSLDLSNGEETSKFEWCKEIFGGEIRELYFTLVTTPDYVYLSRVQEGRKVLTPGLTSVLISTIRENNTLVDATEKLENCYKILTTIPKEALETSKAEDEDKDRTPRGMLFRSPKPFDDQNVILGEYYTPDFDAVSSTKAVALENSSRAVVTLTTDSTGIVAVGTRFDWAGAFLSIEGIQIGALLILGVLLLISILIIAATMTSWLVTTRCVQTGFVSPAEEEDERIFVERDIYGRNAPGLLFEDDEDIQEIQQGLEEAEVAEQGGAADEPVPPSIPDVGADVDLDLSLPEATPGATLAEIPGADSQLQSVTFPVDET